MTQRYFIRFVLTTNINIDELYPNDGSKDEDEEEEDDDDDDGDE